MDKQHNWLNAQVAEGEAASRRIDDKAGALRDEWFKIGHAFLAAKQLYPSTQIFGEWVRTSPLFRWSDDDRACAIKLAEHEAFARKALEGTAVSTARTMWQRVSELFTLASSHRCEVGADGEQQAQTAAAAEKAGEISVEAIQQSDNRHGEIAPRPPQRSGKLEAKLGEDAHFIRAWYMKKDGKNFAGFVRTIIDDKHLLAAVAAAVRSGECVHAPVAGSEVFDIRMAFPHIPTAVAKTVGRDRTWKQFSAKPKGRDKSDWERFAELNDICKARSVYSVEEPAPNGTYRLRERRHEDEIGQAARQWWHSGHWPGERPSLKVHTNEAPPQEPVSTDAVVYYGMTLWPIEQSAWRSSDDPAVPSKQDVDNIYWFVEELHRALVARGLDHRTAARYIRNWSKYIGQLQRPAAAASIMQDMAQGIDSFAIYPDSGLDLKNRIPSRPTKFAAEG